MSTSALLPVTRLAACLALLATSAAGQLPDAELSASDASFNAGFGETVSVDGGSVVVGARNAASNEGRAYVYSGGGASWTEDQILSGSDTVPGDQFGQSVDVDGGVIVVGAPNPLDLFGGSPQGPGAAYMFRLGGTWTEEDKLTASDGQQWDQFGYATATRGGVALVGARGDEPSGLGLRQGGTGAAYVYRFNGSTWPQEQKLTASDASPLDAFGRAVDTDGTVAVVGAPGADGVGTDIGAAYVFRFNGSTWVQEQKLTAADAFGGDEFGQSVGVDGNVIVVGAWKDDDLGGDSGSAYVFRFNGSTWVQEQKLNAADGAADDTFGYAVAVDGDDIAVGAPSDEAGAGAAFQFSFDTITWTQGAKLTEPTATILGASVATEGGTVVSGAPLTDVGATVFAGAAYVFDLSPITDCNNNSIDDAIDISMGTSQDCNTNGIPDECETDCNNNGVPDDCDITAGTSQDCNNNGVPDECDITAGTSQDCNTNGIPDECETDCNNNGVPDDCDITAGTSQDCNNNGVPDECDITAGTSLDCNTNGIPDECETDCNNNGVPDDCDITAGTSQDCNNNGVPDECDITAGTSQDCNTNGIPDECEGPDCNNNGVPDDCDIALGTSTDCNNNGVPDECEVDCNNNGVPDDCDIALGTSLDCNNNGVPDECDITAGTSQDCNTNGIPDECETDCNNNGVPDDCDITAGTSQDCNNNGVPDECDITAGTSQDCNTNGIPDECETDCNNNGVPDDCDITAGTSQDCNNNGVPDECDITAGTSQDCNTNGIPDECEGPDCNNNGVPDECDIALGTSQDCNTNGIPDECETDCNNNGVPDECDITAGTSQDCNNNGVPDECDITAGTSQDCNSNGIPDECETDCNNNGVPDDCDITAGTSQDCNGNGIPDECDISGGTSLDGNTNGIPDECEGVWVDLGNPLAGANGDPLLTGEGPMIAGLDVTITLSNALENSTAALFIGLVAINAPFKSGVLVPAPDILISPLPTSPTGDLPIVAAWPTGVPPGFTAFYQYWIVDPAAPQALSASNGMSSTAP